MLFLIAAMLFDAAAVHRPLPQVENAAAVMWPASTTGCDDGTNVGTLIQRSDSYYGNRMQAPCAGARLRRIRFVHAGSATPRAYRLHVRDAACNEIGVTPVLLTTATTNAPHLETVDIAGDGWCIQGEFRVLLEPLTCPQTSDCYPALVVDGGARGDCAEVAIPAGAGRTCLAARTTDGRTFAFRIRAEFDCAIPACTTATLHRTWTATKRLYDFETPSRP